MNKSVLHKSSSSTMSAEGKLLERKQFGKVPLN